MSKFKLPPERIAALQQAQRDLHDILSDMDEAEECGVDCQNYRMMHQEAAKRIDAILRHYGPSAK